jgi:hypothetical protein
MPASLRHFFNTLGHLFHPRHSNNHRAKLLHLDWLMSLVALTITFGLWIAWLGQTYQGVLGFASNITADQVIAQTNQERANLGLGRLVLNRQLSAAALAKGQDMFSEQYWAHTSPAGKQPWDFMAQSDYQFIVAGENLARDFDTTETMVTAWMASPTHRANIINPRYQEIGIAVINGQLQGVETTLVVQMFGTPRQIAAEIGQSAAQVTVEATEPEFVPNLELRAPQPEVLATIAVPEGSLGPPLFSPLQLSKAFVLAIILMLVSTLLYDGLVVGNRQTMRLVGNNLGHIFFLLAVTFIVLYFKGGLIQ